MRPLPSPPSQPSLPPPARTRRRIAPALASALACALLPACVVEDGGDGAVGGAGGGGAGAAATEATINSCSPTGVLLKGTYSGDLALNCPLYRLEGNTEFRDGSVTIKAGTTFVAGKSATLWINEDSGIRAIGTAADPIVFAPALIDPGQWKAFVVESIRTDNELAFVRIQGGGGDKYYTSAKAALTVHQKGKLALRDCRFADNDGVHLYVGDEATLTAFERNDFGASEGGAALSVPTRQGGALDEATTYAAGDVIGVRGGKAEDDARWRKTAVARRFEGNSEFFKGKWTVDPGVTLELEPSATLWVSEEASLDLAGTAELPIRIRGKLTEPGSWKAFVIESLDPTNRMAHAIVEHGGGDKYYSARKAGLYLKGKARLAVQDCTFQHNDGVGLAIEAEVTLTAFQRNTMKGNKVASMSVYPASLTALDAASDYGAEDEHVEVEAGQADAGGTWPKTNRPLRLSGNVELRKGDYVFAPGAHLQLDTAATLWVGEEASLVAKGSASEPIVLDGKVDVAGAWKAFVIESPDPVNALQFVQIRNGGGDEYYSSAKAGLYLKGKAVLALSDCTFASNGPTDLYAEAGVTLTPADPKAANTFAGDVVLK